MHISHSLAYATRVSSRTQYRSLPFIFTSSMQKSSAKPMSNAAFGPSGNSTSRYKPSIKKRQSLLKLNFEVEGSLFTVPLLAPYSLRHKMRKTTRSRSTHSTKAGLQIDQLSPRSSEEATNRAPHKKYFVRFSVVRPLVAVLLPVSVSCLCLPASLGFLRSKSGWMINFTLSKKSCQSVVQMT